MPDSRAVAAQRFRALGDETRLLLLEILSGGERTVADLMAATGLGQSLVSHHLKGLRAGGLVATRRDGRWIYYAVSETGLSHAKLFLYELEPLRNERRIPPG